MIKCWSCGFGHLTEEELRACHNSRKLETAPPCRDVLTSQEMAERIEAVAPVADTPKWVDELDRLEKVCTGQPCTVEGSPEMVRYVFLFGKHAREIISSLRHEVANKEVQTAKENTMIKPAVGRIVLFTETHEVRKANNGQPFAAIVTYVHSDSLVNLAVFDCNGNLMPRTSVYLHRPENGIPHPQDYYCELVSEVR